jgi:eukaryotic-like serine/threonine-protein kinase
MDINQCPRCKTRFRGEIAVCPVDGETLQRMQDPLLGRTIAGRYLIEDKIGGGGMGIVYRARHQVIARDVAIKFLHARYTRDPTSRQRFLGEARAANQINHENIIDITDFGETDDGLVFLVMEYLQGRSLDHEIAGRPMPARRALRIAAQIAAGLARAHELDVIHRDVKPGNVFLLRRRGEVDVVKLLDFGIARFERELRITDRGALLGTPEYIAPEQVRTGEVSPLTDLYALGCVLFEMLVGRPPFMGNMTEVLVKQMRELPPPPSRLSAETPPEVDALVLKMLQKDPQRRHRDAFHLVEDLRELLSRSQDEPFKASSLPPAGTSMPPLDSKPPLNDSGSRERAARPTMHIPVARDEWAERVLFYKQRLELMHPAGDVPNEVREAMERMEQIVASMARLRGELLGSAEQLTTSEDDVRATRLRVGRALDELASDESKLARALEAEGHEYAAAQDSVQGAIHALLARPAIGAIALRRGQPLSDEDALLLQGLGMVVETLREAQTRAGKLKRVLEKKRIALEDLRFQVEQLKGRFATLNAETSVTQGHAQERVLSADAQLRSELDRLVAEAERVALYVRSKRDVAPAAEPLES